MLFRGLFAGLTWALLAVVASAAEHDTFDAARWESAIRRFEAVDEQSPPPAGGVLFIGSSSIRGWDLATWFPQHKDAVNRGFGGSHMADSTYFAQRIAIAYQPRVIVVYAGDNDIAAGKSPQRVLDDYQAFVKKIHHTLPETRIVYIAIKPSIRRWELIDKMRAANSLIRDAVAGDERQTFVDVDAPMLGADGRPRKELFAADGLHLSEAGYELWSGLVRPHLTVPRMH